MAVPGEGSASGQTGYRSVLIADIVSSTELYERLGDERAKELVVSGLDTMERIINSHGGQLIKSMGDGVLACFKGPEAAMASLEMCNQVAGVGLELRVGAHYGPVIRSGEDIFGDTVNTTARLASAARPREILVSKTLWSQIPKPLQEMGRKMPGISVKGKKKLVEPYSILADVGGVEETILGVASPRKGLEARGIELRFGDASVELDAAGGGVVIGRTPDCDLHVDHEKTSRRHARIFIRPPYVLLEDTSSNGTILRQSDGTQIAVRRREVILFGGGEIYAGSNPDEKGSQPISFKVLSG